MANCLVALQSKKRCVYVQCVLSKSSNHRYMIWLSFLVDGISLFGEVVAFFVALYEIKSEPSRLYYIFRVILSQFWKHIFH